MFSTAFTFLGPLSPSFFHLYCPRSSMLSHMFKAETTTIVRLVNNRSPPLQGVGGGAYAWFFGAPLPRGPFYICPTLT